MPLSSRTFSQLIDFTRTSAATFVNSSGNIASTPQSRNLLTFTNEFANAAWTATRASVTANSTTAPDGTSTADTLVEDSTASNSHRIQRIVNIPGSAITFSLYMKASGRNWAYLRIDDASTTRFAYFNLATGVVGTVNAGLTATITSVGNGWYRCVTTLAAPAATATGNVVFGSATADNSDSYTGTGIASIFIWGAQLEQASAATDYTRNFGGLFPPRFDYDPVSLAPRGLLIEEQRTNLLLRSEEFDNASWTKSRTTATANATTSPDGTVDADKITETTDAGSHRVFQQAAKAASTLTRTFSVYLKAAERTRARIQMSNNNESVSTSADVNLSAGTITNASNSGSATVVAVGSSITNAGNGWYRCTITATYDATVDNPGAFVFILDNTGAVTYTGDGTSGIFVWGAQWEDGAFATSYIPTVASQVTRSADVAAINAPNFASWFNQTAGSFVFEGTILAASTAEHQLGYGVGGGTFGVNLRVNDRFGAGTRFLNTDASLDIAIATSPTPNTVTKIAAAYSGGTDAALVRGGGAAATDTSYSASAGNTLIVLGANASGTGAFLNGHIRSLRYYPTRLTNAQLQALTA